MRCCYHDFRILHSCPPVFIIHVRCTPTTWKESIVIFYKSILNARQKFEVQLCYLYRFHPEGLLFPVQHLPIPKTFEVQWPVSLDQCQ
jgi:hypothetical protein